MVDAKDPFAFANELGKLNSAAVAVEPKFCVHVRNKAASCQRCAVACKEGAICFRETGFSDVASFSVNPDHCVECGACAHACPTAALSATERAGSEGLGPDSSNCRGEVRRALPVVARLVADTASEAPAHVGANGILPQQVPSSRMRMLSVLGSGESLPAETPVTWGKVSINVGVCRSCRMCAAFCPTGALTRYEAAGERGLQHQPAKCVDCRLCADVCPAGAITVQRGIEPGKLRRNVAVRIPLPDPVWLPTGTNQIREKMKVLIDTQTLA